MLQAGHNFETTANSSQLIGHLGFQIFVWYNGYDCFAFDLGIVVIDQPYNEGLSTASRES